MTEIDGKQATLIARHYFEDILKISVFNFAPIHVDHDETKKLWKLQIELAPFYNEEKKKLYNFKISETGEIVNVEQIPANRTNGNP